MASSASTGRGPREGNAMDWLLILISACIALALGMWMILHEDGSTSRRGRHRLLAARRPG
jgi:hypothetical protein